MGVNVRVLGLVAVAALGACSGSGIEPVSAPTSDVVVTSEVVEITTASSAVAIPSGPERAVLVNRALRRTLNIGGVLEVPLDDDWGIELELTDIDRIAEVGFSAIRVPVRWSDWASPDEPYALDPEVHRRVDAVVDRALANDLAVIIDVHSYEELATDPLGHRDRFLAIWRQIAEHNAELPDTVVFEVVNEPNGVLAGQGLNEMLVDSVSVIRESNPDRTIMVGPGEWYSPSELSVLTLPEDDNLIVSVHYYDPFEFTHQGASWVSGSDAWLGTGWGGSDARNLVRDQLGAVRDWADERDVPVFVGEFGAVSTAGAADRVEWVAAVTEETEALGMAWGYWDWATPTFGVYDLGTGAWDESILDALLGPKE